MNTLLIGTGALFVLFFALHWNASHKVKQLKDVKRQEDRYQRQKWTKIATGFRWAWVASLIAVIISGVLSLQGTASKTITLTHVHGLGYSGDGQRILIPSHLGLKVYSQGKWSDGQGEKHDYMGFTTVDNGFYSSGHPAQGSNKRNPFGIVKSSDEGKSFEILDLYGEIDFHLMSASYKTHTIYAVNPEPNSRLTTTGLYYSKDDAKTWNKSEMTGIDVELSELTSLAVHPSDDSIVAVGTTKALYVSKDSGNQFEKIADLQVTSLTFGMEGNIIVGSYKQKGVIYQMDLQQKQLVEVNIPDLVEDAASYIAQNPTNTKELVFATFNLDVYISLDEGMNWRKIADKGKGV
ncbi:glycosyl hydrolase [Paenibacillus validus]|uniref:F510_1955 family glycosylhydrolase n=1 Tax=Paenibacillus TaxID=44249 RepID=UPI0013DF35A6|nr:MULTISPECIES: glycosyl hydrolase [Paenibacillus]MED4599693.1 glycosyl hydrolase [Paenibacillus validus]MED4604874.1 glycosyl hydrolase [Paenibacillus validus]